MAKFQQKLFAKFHLAKTSSLFHNSNPPIIQDEQNTNFSQTKPKLMIRIQILVAGVLHPTDGDCDAASRRTVVSNS